MDIKKTLFVIIVVACNTFCSGQKYTLENRILDCHYKLFKNKSTDIRQTIKSQEELFIRENILTDSSGNSYIALLNKIINDKDFQIESSISIWEKDPIGDFERSELEEIMKCETKVLSNAEEGLYKWGIIVKKMDSLNPKVPKPEYIAKFLLSVLTKNDFENDFYKLKFFYVIEMVHTMNGGRQKLPPISTE